MSEFQVTTMHLDQGIWTTPSMREVPDGALIYAQNCEYRNGTRSLFRRGGTQWANAFITGYSRFMSLLSYKNIAGTVDKIVGVVTHITGNRTDLMWMDWASGGAFVAIDSNITPSIGDIAQGTHWPTQLVYNDIIYTSPSGADPTRAWNGTTARAAGITNPTPAIVPTVVSIAGTGITVSKAYHFTYRYYNSTDKVKGELINGNNLILSTTYPASSGSTVQGFELLGLPTTSPATGVDKIQVFMSLDEDVPSAFYLIETMTLGSGPLLRPTAFVITTAGTVIVRNSAFAYDGSPETKAIFTQDNRTVAATAGEFRYTTFATETRADWRIEVDYTYGLSGGTPGNTTIDYSTNGGGAWTTMVTLSTTAAGFTTVAASPVGSISSANIMVRVTPNGYSPAALGAQVNLAIYDIRLMTTAASGRVTIGRVPTAREEFVNSASFGHFQPPPKRVFPYTFEGHALGVSDQNGLWLAYSETDQPEAWSTDVNLAAFPFLVPFKDNEVDTLIGACPIRGQLIVLCTDSVWRINHLPVLSDPEADAALIFAEARSVSKQRVTDSSGCVNEAAYTHIQLGTGQDVLFYWSAAGPMVTDGFSVWRVAEHVDWFGIGGSSSSAGVVLSVINDHILGRVIVSFLSGHALALYYRENANEEATVESVKQQWRVIGPWQITDSAGTVTVHAFGPGAIRLNNTTVTGGEFRNIVFGSVTGTEPRMMQYDEDLATDANAVEQIMKFITKRFSTAAHETHFSHAVLNTVGINSDNLPYGSQSISHAHMIDQDPLEINTQAADMRMEVSGTTVTFTSIAEDGSAVTNPSATQSVTAVNQYHHFSIFHKPTRPIAD